MPNDAERVACTPIRPKARHFNPNARIPFGVTVDHVRSAMEGFCDFLGFVNGTLHEKGLVRFETMLMPANFSSIVGEFMTSNIPKACPSIVKNRYHNGHPDLIPANAHHNDMLQHGTEGIEVKGSRYLRGWQGHNAEDAWLMVFCFASDRPVDLAEGAPPKPFRFVLVCGAQLRRSDWKFSGRSETSRRTITASVTRSGYDKMMANWIYKDPEAFDVEAAEEASDLIVSNPPYVLPGRR